MRRIAAFLAGALVAGSVAAQLGSPPQVGSGAGVLAPGGGIPVTGSPATGMASSSSPDAAAPPPYGSVFEGIASWYGAEFKGRKTSSGEIYDPEALTAAHRSLPFGTLLRVTDLDTGASVVVRVNDRGPFVAGRILDLSEAAARLIGVIATGTAPVRCELLRPEDAAAFGPPAAPGSAASTQAPAAARVCRIQVASYANPSNARATVERLRLSGIVATIETAGLLNRVLIEGVPETDVGALADRLGGLGYRGLVVSYSP